MEFFRQANLDWMGKAKYFVALSLTLLIVGGASLYHKHGLRYGIDFKGGTLVYVRFAQLPPLDKIRQGLAQQGLGNSVIQGISDLTNPNSKDVVIGLEEHGTGSEALDAGKAAILQALRRTLDQGEGSKQDLNATTTTSLSEFLARRDPLALGAALLAHPGSGAMHPGSGPSATRP